MTKKQPFITSAATPPRHFAAYPAALQSIIMNSQREVLLLNSPTRGNGWQTVSGGMEARETVLAGTLREIDEEVGPNVNVRPLGTLHVESFHYDQNVRYMIAVYTLFDYLGGDIQPGDDMVGSEVRWWPVDDLLASGEKLHITVKPWLMKRAAAVYDAWVAKQGIEFQPQID
ncbi:MAG: NUDIX hydrolase [Chloroflexota bacterium]